MAADKLSRYWLLATFLLIVIIITSSLIIWIRQDNGESIIIDPPQPSVFSGDITVDGAVVNPGTYPLQAGDSIESILQASGGTNEKADLSRLHLYVPQVDVSDHPQKVDINRADIWLLQTLPNIGEVRAGAIIEYRQKNGLFRNTRELTDVPGIGEATFEKIKDLVTVAEY